MYRKWIKVSIDLIENSNLKCVALCLLHLLIGRTCPWLQCIILWTTALKITSNRYLRKLCLLPIRRYVQNLLTNIFRAYAGTSWGRRCRSQRFYWTGRPPSWFHFIFLHLSTLHWFRRLSSWKPQPRLVFGRLSSYSWLRGQATSTAHPLCLFLKQRAPNKSIDKDFLERQTTQALFRVGAKWAHQLPDACSCHSQ